MVLLVLGASCSVQAQAKTKTVYKIPVEGKINPGMVKLVTKGIEAAEAEGADQIILEIDTYGGLVDSAIKIKDAIFSSSVPTVTYVSGRAWSAGALIALAGEELMMTPGSSIGAAETRPESEKYISALRKEFKAAAERRGKNAELAAAMVDKDLEIPKITEAGKLVTLTAQEAVDNEFADGIEADFNSLLSRLNLAQAEVKEAGLTPAEKLAGWITNPGVSILLLTVGFLALAFEAVAPGWGVGGTVGLLSLGLFFSGYIINGVASWGLLVLFMVGIVLLALEVFVVPGFGVTGTGGIIAMGASLYFVFPNPEIALGVLATTLVLSVLGTWLLIRYFGGTYFWRRIALRETQTKESGYVSHKRDNSELVGKTGETKGTLRPAGIAEIEEERMNVISEGGFIEPHQRVKVVKVEGNKIIVRKIAREE